MATKYILAISKPGFPAKDITVAGRNNFIFHSESTTLSIKSLQHSTVTTQPVDVAEGSEGRGNILVPHAFGYVPKFLAFVETFSGDYVQLDYETTLDVDSKLPYENFTIEVGKENFLIDVTAYSYTFFPMIGVTSKSAIVRTYTFDVILFMERIGLGVDQETA